MNARSRPGTPPTRPLRGGGVYVHIPFCNSICSYCHFSRTTAHDPQLRRRYAEAVLKELALRDDACRLQRFRTDTLYIGGGTPSVLEAPVFADLLAGLLDRLHPAVDAEITAEANPETLTPALAATWRRAGVNRVSLGVQSLQDDVLATLGRQSTPASAREALSLAVTTFPAVSADWILAPGLDPDELARDFGWARDLGIGHISFYILEVHAGTSLAARIGSGVVKMFGDARIATIYLQAVARLADLGYRQYEVSNFALPGQESRHNQAYWQHKPYLGLGVSANGYWGRRRYANLARTTDYLEAVSLGALPVASVDVLDRPALELERLILPLRTSDGVPLQRVPLNTAELAAGVDQDLWTVTQGRLRLTPRGFLHIDSLEQMMAPRLVRNPASA